MKFHQAAMIADVLRAGLATLFVVSASLKMVAPVDLAATAVRLGVPSRLMTGRWRSMLTPIVITGEILLTVGLLTPAAARPAALLSAIWLGGMGVLVAKAVRRGRRVPCGCFGAIGHDPVTWGTAARNAVAAAAAIALMSGGSVRSDRAWAVAAVTLLVAASIAFGLLAREYRRVRVVRPLAGPADRPVRLADGSATTLAVLLSGRGGVLLFTDPSCAPCRRVVGQVRSGRIRSQDGAQLVVVSRGSTADNRSLAANLAALGVPVVVQQDFEIAEALGVRGTPTAVRTSAEAIPIDTAAVGFDAIVAVFGAGQPVARFG